MLPSNLEIRAVPDIPWVEPGDDIASLLLDALASCDDRLEHGDILVVTQKIVSKAENRYRSLSDAVCMAQAQDLAEITGKDPRLVQVILDESLSIVASAPGILITKHKSGHTLANAGIDQSNISRENEWVLLLPENADRSAKKIRKRIRAATRKEVSVIVADSAGRPWRLGTVGIALGASGLTALWDRRGESDGFGNVLNVTQMALADMISSAAVLVMGEGAEGRPAALVRGLDIVSEGQTAQSLLRPPVEDLFLER